MVRALTLALLAWAAQPASAEPLVLDTAEARHAFIVANRTPVALTPVAIERGCEPAGCNTYLGDLAIGRDTGLLRFKRKQTLRLLTHADNAPDLDWTPAKAFRVAHQGKDWGMCLEFSHTGLGKSGRFQRWRSVILLPWKGARPAPVAHRFVGYWTACNDLTDGGKAGEIALALIAPVENAPTPLRLLAWTCNAKTCHSTPTSDLRLIQYVPDSETGAISVGD